MSEKLIVSIDQGTSSSRALVFSTLTGKVMASHQILITPTYPASGWIELDAKELYETTLQCLNECMKQLNDRNMTVDDIAGLGMTNQRETTIVWDHQSGEPLAPAIVWSDARTADLVKKFIQRTPSKNANAFQSKTGLPIHSYFSALKICWLLENNSSVAEVVKAGKALAGTVDSWIIWRLTAGKHHVTDVTNASRTLLFNLETLNWDNELCKFFEIDQRMLPKVVSSSEIVGTIEDPRCTMSGVKICGILGDQQASLVGQTWPSTENNNSNGHSSSDGPTVKVTYGTGAFMLWDIGTTPFFSDSGILTTVAFKMGAKEKVHYALEGSVSFAGATINWLRGKLELFSDYDELERLTKEAYDQHKPGSPDPCYLVPAFSGLFCPWWQEDARGTLAGLTADVKRHDMLYAGVRSSVYQTQDVLRVATLAKGGSGTLEKPREIVVDGGMANNTVLMQSLADILDMIVTRHNHSEYMTALGAAVAAALAVDIDPSGLLKLRLHPETSGQPTHTFSSSLSAHSRAVMVSGWHAAVERSLGWLKSSSLHEASDSLLELMRKMKIDKDDQTPLMPSVGTVEESILQPKQKQFSISPTKLLVFAGFALIIGFGLGRV